MGPLEWMSRKIYSNGCACDLKFITQQFFIYVNFGIQIYIPISVRARQMQLLILNFQSPLLAVMIRIWIRIFSKDIVDRYYR
jgi:hypothetical protein